jgi:hypothetical protein
MTLVCIHTTAAEVAMLLGSDTCCRTKRRRIPEVEVKRSVVRTASRLTARVTLIVIDLYWQAVGSAACFPMSMCVPPESSLYNHTRCN